MSAPAPAEAAPATTADALADDALFDLFEAGTLPEAHFSHRQHVRVAWLYLCRNPPAVAIARFQAALRRLAAGYGKPHLYHETITWAYLLLINERRLRQEAERGAGRAAGVDEAARVDEAAGVDEAGRAEGAGGVEGPAADGGGWQAFATANPDLLTWRPSALAAYYREETLASELARRVFVLPDRGHQGTATGTGAGRY